MHKAKTYLKFHGLGIQVNYQYTAGREFPNKNIHI